MIVPGFDVAEYAGDALDSLRAQTRDDWVAILVDDASTDATGAIFDAAAAADDRFRVVHHAARAGLGAARNTGLDLVETPFVGFLDADDRLTPRALERLVGTVAASGSDFAVGAYVRLRPDGDGGYAPGSRAALGVGIHRPGTHRDDARPASRRVAATSWRGRR